VTRNRGISLASGDYIAFIDADDLWTPDKLESQFKALQANPQAAVAYSWTNHIDESSQFSRTGSHMTVSGNVYAKLLLANFLENGSNPLIRRQALTTVGGFDETLIAAEDWDMYLRLAAHYHFVAVPSPQILYRISIDSMSSNVYKQEKESVKVIKKAFIQAPKFLQHLKKQSLANLYKYLTFKTLEGDPERQRGIKAAHFLWHCIINDPSLLRKRVIWKVGFTIAVMALLSPTKAQALLAKSKQLANHRMLLLHMQLEPL
jgi:GT2 family glycosyltransferase